ncbi:MULTISPECIES: AraC family transcriptional regulator [Flavobacterium]|uniref:AraC family transcriptional regulator n=1 Tax=Flavobacterium cupriresistens TaxID=2893885 RepID=A0ABU4RF64_9FLAO|nr:MULTISPECIES: AraC family transcriptional regulator [unclassified Flavobacterium]KLT68337.1 transcriptional regulator [Flavobacterium sp. ABG]MDX6191243.1 AraC family transcriptional regulator [Flavobacterium sp. Fl-318]UFH42438.1 AraC family transcriptional regulator [Flavobacterium sp. F-323]
MKNNVRHEPYELVLTELVDQSQKSEQTDSFFELVYIVKGNGLQHFADHTFAYQQGHLFLLTPKDSHRLEFEEPTQLFSIRFNTVYLNRTSQQEILRQIEVILKNASHEPGCVLKSDDDKKIVHPLIEAIIREHQTKGLYQKELLTQYINTLLVIVARNVMLSLPEKINDQSDQKVIQILQYVQANIYNPEKLRGEHIGTKFGISESYLGRFFRKHTNETLQQYQTTYKLNLIENRLLHTHMRINEIADEFGFTDKSHLNNMFKKHRGFSPSEYRKMFYGLGGL